MSIAANSIVIRIILFLWHGLVRFWNNSAIGRWLCRVEQAVCTCASNSPLCRFLARDGLILRTWPDSMLCRIVVTVINIPCAFAKWIYKLAKGLWDGSIVFRVISTIGTAAWIPLALLLMVMLCVPHDIWDNLYAFLGLLLVAVLFFVGSMVRSKQRLQVERFGPYMVLYLAFIVYGLIASFSTSLSVRFFIFHMTCFLIVLLMVSGINKYNQLHWLVALVGLGLLAAAVYGCYQGYVGVEVVKSQQDLLLNENMPGRIYSFFDNPNNFAEILVMLVPLMLALLINARTFKGKCTALVVIGASVIAPTSPIQPERE